MGDALGEPGGIVLARVALQVLGRAAKLGDRFGDVLLAGVLLAEPDAARDVFRVEIDELLQRVEAPPCVAALFSVRRGPPPLLLRGAAAACHSLAASPVRPSCW